VITGDSAEPQVHELKTDGSAEQKKYAISWDDKQVRREEEEKEEEEEEEEEERRVLCV